MHNVASCYREHLHGATAPYLLSYAHPSWSERPYGPHLPSTIPSQTYQGITVIYPKMLMYYVY